MHTAHTAAAVAALLFGLAGAPALAPTFAQTHPDFTGVYSNASLTPLTRPPGQTSLTVGKEEAQKIANRTAIAGIAADDPDFKNATYSDPSKGAPEKGGKDFGLKGYDSFWVSPGTNLALVHGEYRTSIVVDPSSGQLPYKDAAAVMRERQPGAVRYLTGVGGNSGPEDTNLAERCLIGFSQTGGPGMLSALYNNNYRFVQTKDALMILVEMDHDARIVPIYASEAEARAHHKPNVIKPWLGDSVGWWEGDTLAFETINVHPQQLMSGQFALSPKGRVVERLTKDGEAIFYSFTVDDPDMYKQVWKGELTFNPIKGNVYEYACHEGNYAMPHMLAGQRLLDAEKAAAADKRPKPGKG